jgi:hypothetical protein
LGPSSALSEFTAAFADADDATLGTLVGRFRATMAGPWWMRLPAPSVVGLTGMPGWWGKEFFGPAADDGTLRGHNLLDSHGTLTPSLPMTARLGTSRQDGRAALLLTYPGDTPRPWRHVTDEVRALADGRLLGLSYDIVPGISTAVPFLLQADDAAGRPSA